MRKVYYNPISCADPDYMHSDGLQGEIDADFARANRHNLAENAAEVKSRERTVKMKKLS